MTVSGKIISAAVVGLLFGVFVGFGIANTTAQRAPSADDPQATLEQLRTLIREEYPEYFDEDAEILKSGIVREVDGQTVRYEAAIPEIVILASDLSSTQSLMIEENAMMMRHVPKPESVYQAELEAYEAAEAQYQRQISELSGEQIPPEPPIYPSPVDTQEASLSDIRIGDQIRIGTREEQVGIGQPGADRQVIILQEAGKPLGELAVPERAGSEPEELPEAIGIPADPETAIDESDSL